MTMGFSAVYVHIPFCLQKCRYCDFLSYPGQPPKEKIAQYLAGLKKEFVLWQETMAGPIFTPGSDVTVYFGGGTPSLLPAGFIGEMITMLEDATSRCGAILREVTMEMNPGTIDRPYLQALKAAGVTRVSLGVQSFSAEDLQRMGRIHSVSDSIQSVQFCKESGISNISLDLIYNLPGQTVEKWLYNLQQAVSLDIAHLSCYGLHLSEKSPWGKMLALGQLTLPAEEEEIAMWEKGRAYLQKNGFVQYEISNFAKQGKQCLHNLKYWQRENYLGLGIDAASCYGNYRWSNQENITQYFSALENHQLPVDFQEQLEDAVVLAEAVFLGLRCLDGVVFAQMKAKYRVDIAAFYEKEIALLEKQGLLNVTTEKMQLTERGLLLANTVFATFLPE